MLLLSPRASRAGLSVQRGGDRESGRFIVRTQASLMESRAD